MKKDYVNRVSLREKTYPKIAVSLISMLLGRFRAFPYSLCVGVGHECFFEEQIITMLMQMETCSCKLNDNSLSGLHRDFELTGSKPPSERHII